MKPYCTQHTNSQLGTSMEHHWCFKIFVKKSKSERVTDIVFFTHKYLTHNVSKYFTWIEFFEPPKSTIVFISCPAYVNKKNKASDEEFGIVIVFATVNSLEEHTTIFILECQNHVHCIVETTRFNALEGTFLYCTHDNWWIHQRQYTFEALASAIRNGPAMCTCAEWPTSFRYMTVKLVTVVTWLVVKSWRRPVQKVGSGEVKLRGGNK